MNLGLLGSSPNFGYIFYKNGTILSDVNSAFIFLSKIMDLSKSVYTCYFNCEEIINGLNSETNEIFDQSKENSKGIRNLFTSLAPVIYPDASMYFYNINSLKIEDVDELEYLLPRCGINFDEKDDNTPVYLYPELYMNTSPSRLSDVDVLLKLIQAFSRIFDMNKLSLHICSFELYDTDIYYILEKRMGVIVSIKDGKVIQTMEIDVKLMNLRQSSIYLGCQLVKELDQNKIKKVTKKTEKRVKELLSIYESKDGSKLDKLYFSTRKKSFVYRYYEKLLKMFANSFENYEKSGDTDKIIIKSKALQDYQILFYLGQSDYIDNSDNDKYIKDIGNFVIGTIGINLNKFLEKHFWNISFKIDFISAYLDDHKNINESDVFAISICNLNTSLIELLARIIGLSSFPDVAISGINSIFSLNLLTPAFKNLFSKITGNIQKLRINEYCNQSEAFDLKYRDSYTWLILSAYGK